MGVSTELETCAACHLRRKVIADSPAPGAPYLDGFLPALLEPGLYSLTGADMRLALVGGLPAFRDEF